MKSILDPDFRYVPSASTDLRKTFARIRRDARKVAASDGREAVAVASPRVILFNTAKKALRVG